MNVINKLYNFKENKDFIQLINRFYDKELIRLDSELTGSFLEVLKRGILVSFLKQLKY